MEEELHTHATDDNALNSDCSDTEMSVVMHEDLKNVTLANYDFESFIQVFQRIEVNICDFWLVNYGINPQGERKFTYLIIRACAAKPFFGPHLVSFVTTSTNDSPVLTTVWVHSLTFLRKELFQFQDRLSFERSTFICPYQDSSVLIRLKSIRGFLHIPHKAIEAPEMAICTTRKCRSREKINLLLNKNIQALITFISRELQMSIKESISEINQYTGTYCQFLINKFS